MQPVPAVSLRCAVRTPREVFQVSAKYLTIAEAAEYLGMSIQFVRKHQVEMQARKFGGKLVYTAAELDAWAEAQRQATA